ncbi:MAG: polymer-forming cytoskeletal protein [Bacteroides sp.]|nr:polymer-forming cytoskeletal protein [Prevotella sp.]MCM1407996.1 polymer-forming cytoskeletal protein [Treponema brennaborense]MCM1468972.1 polymer-forming cytoskeletal protein [Bacteroides sp.]
MPEISDDITINTLVGSGSVITGDIRAVGFIRIDGDIKGNLETTGRVIIGKNARIRGNVSAKSAIVGGLVEGDILAPESIQLFPTAAVIGDVITHKLQLAEGVVLQGFCISLEKEEEFETAKNRWQDMKIIRQKSYISI